MRTLLICGFVGLLFGVLAIAFVVWDSQEIVWIPSCTGNGGRWGPREYYDGERIPDGWYYVCGGNQEKNGEIFFPLCPSSGTRLHGIWQSTVYLEENYQGNVRVENSIIVEIEKH